MTPSKGIMSAPCPACGGERRTPGGLLLHRGLHRVLDVLDLLELHVDQPASDLLDAPDVDRLDDVARLRVDGDGTAGALPRHALGGGDEAVPVGLAAGLL